MSTTATNRTINFVTVFLIPIKICFGFGLRFSVFGRSLKKYDCSVVFWLLFSMSWSTLQSVKELQQQQQQPHLQQQQQLGETNLVWNFFLVCAFQERKKLLRCEQENHFFKRLEFLFSVIKKIKMHFFEPVSIRRKIPKFVGFAELFSAEKTRIILFPATS